MKRTKIFLGLLVTLAMVLSLFGMAIPVAAGVLDGYVDAGPGVLIIPDPTGDVGLPTDTTDPMPPPGTISGWDMTDLRLAYNETTDTMYVGINTVVILGDADGDGNPGATSAWLAVRGGTDIADLGGSETVAVYFDLDQDGTYDVIAGIGSGMDYYDFSVNVFEYVGGSIFFPPGNFGTALPGNTGDISPNPDATHPDLEFTITDWSTLPGHDDEPGFCVGAMLGSLEDDGIGEDFLEYCQSPCIDIEKTVDCNDDGVYLDEDTGSYGDTPSWFIEVTNCGDCDLYDVYVSDDYGPGWGPFDLPIGESWNVTYDHPTAIYADTTNNATAVAVDAAGLIVGPVYDAATNVVEIFPDICIEKLVDCNDDQEYLHEDYGYSGDTPSWFIRVWNCGDSPLHGVNVTDTNGESWGPFDLAVNASWNVTYTGDAIYETTTNNATAVGLDVLGGVVGPVYDAATNVVIEPNICIEKLVDCNDDEEYLHEDTGSYGDTPSWRITVWNCGDSPLHSVNVTDTNGMSWGPFDLAVNASWNVTYTGDAIYETTTNNATAVGLDVFGGVVGPVYDAATNVIEIFPGICIEKLVDCNDDEEYLHEDTGSYGDTPSWFIRVWNCGDSPLHGVNVTDTNGMSWGPFDLDVGESWNVTYDHSGPIYEDTTNNATAVGLDVLGGVVGPVFDSATNIIEEERCWGDETAWAYGGSYANPNWDYVNNRFWGWTNGPLPEGSYEWDIYAGAGQNDLSKGTVVGKLYVEYAGGCVNVTYELDEGYYLGETHLWVGDDVLPEVRRGRNRWVYTNAPGQFPYGVDYGFDPADPSTWETEWSWTGCGFSGNIYVAAHAVVWMEVECPDDGGEIQGGDVDGGQADGGVDTTPETDSFVGWLPWDPSGPRR